jgi:hypothetical protein
VDEIEKEAGMKMRALQTRIRTRRSAIKAPEAIKTAVVLPFIAALGYDPFDPAEVSAGHQEEGVKVDYAIRDGDEARILIVLNSSPEGLSSDRGRMLVEATRKLNASCAILTNGFVYNVYGRSDEGLDPEPLLIVDIESPRDISDEGLVHLSSTDFDMAALAAGVDERRGNEAVLVALGEELADPSSAFVDAVGARIEATGLKRPASLAEAVARLAGPLSNQVGGPAAVVMAADGAPVAGAAAVADELAMNDEELLAYSVIRAIAVRSGLDAERIVARPGQRYVAILLDDNNRRQVARIHFKTQSVKYLGTFASDGRETREKVAKAADIYNFDKAILDRITELMTPASMAETG